MKKIYGITQFFIGERFSSKWLQFIIVLLCNFLRCGQKYEIDFSKKKHVVKNETKHVSNDGTAIRKTVVCVDLQV